MTSTHLLTDVEAADILRLTPRQVTRLARRGELPSITLPGNAIRFDPDDIREWVNGLKQFSESAKFARRLTGQPKPEPGQMEEFVRAITEGDRRET